MKLLKKYYDDGTTSVQAEFILMVLCFLLLGSIVTMP